MVNVAVIGLGWVGPYHLRGYSAVPDVRIVAISDLVGDLFDLSGALARFRHGGLSVGTVRSKRRQERNKIPLLHILVIASTIATPNIKQPL